MTGAVFQRGNVGALGAEYNNVPTAREMEWQKGGTCREIPNSDELFFPEGRSTAFIEHRAAKLCERCPIIQECRDWALTRVEKYGVWGGMTERQRKDIWRKQGKQLKRVQ